MDDDGVHDGVHDSVDDGVDDDVDWWWRLVILGGRSKDMCNNILSYNDWWCHGDVFDHYHFTDADGNIDDGADEGDDGGGDEGDGDDGGGDEGDGDDGGGDEGDGDDGGSDEGQNDKEFRWETTDAETTQLRRPRSLGQGQLTRLLILTMFMIMILIKKTN